MVFGIWYLVFGIWYLRGDIFLENVGLTQHCLVSLVKMVSSRENCLGNSAPLKHWKQDYTDINGFYFAFTFDLVD